MKPSAYKDFEIISMLRSMLSVDSLVSLRKLEGIVEGAGNLEESLVESGYCSDTSAIMGFDPEEFETLQALSERLTGFMEKSGLPSCIIVRGMGVFAVSPFAQGLSPGTGKELHGNDSARMQNKVVIITGGAQGFGAGIAESFFREGANVVIADLNEEKGNELVDGFNENEQLNTAFFVKCDVSDLASVDELVNRTALHYGGVDVMISNAGILKAGGLDEMTQETFELITKVNYAGYFNCAKAAARIMKLQSAASKHLYFDIIQINSKSGLSGSNRNFAYAGGKFGGIGLTQSFALELMPYRIKVNSICPGNFFEGPLWADPEKGLFVQYLKAGKVPGATSIEDVKKFYENQVPAGRGCGTEDVARAAFYAIEQLYETGQAIPVTGGQIMLH